MIFILQVQENISCVEESVQESTFTNSASTIEFPALQKDDGELIPQSFLFFQSTPTLKHKDHVCAGV